MTFPVFNPMGSIAAQERDLIITALLVMSVAVIPVFILLFTFARKYRAGNPKAKYTPDHEGSTAAMLGLWAIPAFIIFIIGIINWNSTHALDPYKPIASATPPLTIQVVALQWKWLFIYPGQDMATVNYVEFPVNTPLHFELTADAPMNLFWIPQLGSEIYAMPAMSTQLNLIANETGDFRGMAAEINGPGFAGMKFIARSVSDDDFNNWARSVKQSSPVLSLNAYDQLAEPSENAPSSSYASVESGLYNEIMMKYMAPPGTSSPQMVPGMQM